MIVCLTYTRPSLWILKWFLRSCVNSRHSIHQLLYHLMSRRVSNGLEWGRNWVPEDGRCFIWLSFSYLAHSSYAAIFILAVTFFLFCFKPGEDVAHCSQFLVAGPCYVLFLGELQQPGINRCISGLCWTREFCARCCGPPYVCSHILWAYSVADCCRVVYHPWRPRHEKVRLLWQIFYLQYKHLIDWTGGLWPTQRLSYSVHPLFTNFIRDLIVLAKF